MYNFETQQHTLWEKPPVDKLLCVQLKEIANRTIKKVLEWWDENSEFLTIMPEIERQVLFNAHLVSFYLGKYEHVKANKIADEVYGIIKEGIGLHEFYGEIYKVVEPYLDEHDKRIEDAFMDCLTP